MGVTTTYQFLEIGEGCHNCSNISYNGDNGKILVLACKILK